MSTAVFKNTRLPPLFGTKEFISKPYLNLYTEEDANEINEYRRSMSMSISNMATPDNIGRDNPSPDFLPPPPPIETILKPAENNGALLPPPRMSEALGTSSQQLPDQRRVVPTNIPPSAPIPSISGVAPSLVLNLPPPPPPPPLT